MSESKAPQTIEAMSTPGREGADWWTLTTVARADIVLLLKERDDLRVKVADLERALADEDGCRQLALGRAVAAEARVAAIEAERDAFKADAANLLEALENRLEAWETREADHAHGETQARVRKLEAEYAAVADELGARPHSSALAKVREWVRVLITEAGGQYTDQDLLEAVAVVRRRLAELEAAQRWVPVGERLPGKNGEGVLVVNGGRWRWPVIV